MLLIRKRHCSSLELHDTVPPGCCQKYRAWWDLIGHRRKCAELGQTSTLTTSSSLSLAVTAGNKRELFTFKADHLFTSLTSPTSYILELLLTECDKLLVSFSNYSSRELWWRILARESALGSLTSELTPSKISHHLKLQTGARATSTTAVTANSTTVSFLAVTWQGLVCVPVLMFLWKHLNIYATLQRNWKWCRGSWCSDITETTSLNKE